MKKVRITLIALALTLSIGGAFATKMASKAKFGTDYFVLSETATEWTVQTNEPDGAVCNETINNRACDINSSVAPTSGKISKSGLGTTASVTQVGQYQ